MDGSKHHDDAVLPDERAVALLRRQLGALRVPDDPRRGRLQAARGGPLLQRRNDWDNAREVYSNWVTVNEDIYYGTAYVDLNAVTGTTPRAFVQFGIETLNRSASTISFCRGTLRVEPKQN